MCQQIGPDHRPCQVGHRLARQAERKIEPGDPRSGALEHPFERGEIGQSLVLAAAPCAVGAEWRDEGVVQLVPSCAPAFTPTQEGVRTATRQAGRREELLVGFGRVALYPWLSALLARQASSSRRWPEERDAPEGYVTRALMGMPEFTALFDPPWRIASIVVKDVRLKAAAELDLPQGHPLPRDFALPYDAELLVTLTR